MKILFAAPENAWGGFLNLLKERLPGHEYVANGSFNLNSLSGYDILIPTMSKITPELLESADRLQLIQQCGAGLEAVDIGAANEREIAVANVPTDISGNADSVAELGIYLMLGLSRNVAGMSQGMKSGKMGEPRGISVSGKTVGIIGLGGIGKALIQRLKPFGVNLIGIKSSAVDEVTDPLGLDWVGSPKMLPKLLADSDYVFLSLPANKETAGLMNPDTFAMMKSSAYLINLSRGVIVDRNALENALREKQIAGAGLDVFWEEPPNPNDPIFSYNIMATPHVGGSTDVSMEGIANAVAENIRRVEKGEIPLYKQ